MDLNSSVNDAEFFTSYLREIQRSKKYYSNKSIIKRISENFLKKSFQQIESSELERILKLKGRNINQILKNKGFVKKYNTKTWEKIKSFDINRDLHFFDLSRQKKKIIGLLNEKPSTCRELCISMNISIQAVRNYIIQINERIPKLIVFDRGNENEKIYSLNREVIDKYSTIF